jgi:hypothetical protein
MEISLREETEVVQREEREEKSCSKNMANKLGIRFR